MRRGRNYTAGERAVCVVGVLAGKPLMEINEQLRADAEKCNGTLRQLPESSHEMLKRQYAPALVAGASNINWGDVWDHIVEPKRLGDL